MEAKFVRAKETTDPYVPWFCWDGVDFERLETLIEEMRPATEDWVVVRPVTGVVQLKRHAGDSGWLNLTPGETWLRGTRWTVGQVDHLANDFWFQANMETRAF